MALDTDREKCAHLLRRFGLGASEAEVDYYLQDGFSGAIERLLEYHTVDEGFPILLGAQTTPQTRLNTGQVVNWWVARLIMTQRPLQEKMTVFWHDHFATSAAKVGSAGMMAMQNETLRHNATGNFRAMLREVSKDPAMILWLDNQQNVKGHANENFAREVMELFTLGIGHYTEKDIQESARAFTGWSVQRIPDSDQRDAEFRFRVKQHDPGLKQCLGESGNLDGEQILDILCDNPRTSEFIAWKMWRWFAYENPAPELITRLAANFRASGLDIKTLIKSIVRSSEFYSAEAERKEYKNPIDFCVAPLRQLGVGSHMLETLKASPDGQLPKGFMGPVGATVQVMRLMGMWLMYPPDVSGWAPGQGWISSATMVERIAWGDRLFSTAPGIRYALRLPAYALLKDDPTPEGVVARLTTILDAPIGEKYRPILVSAARKASNGTLTPQNAGLTAAAVCRLLFATSEYQFC